MRARNVLSSNLRTGFRFTSFAKLRLLHAYRVQKKIDTRLGVYLFLEAPPRFGLGVEVLQTFALPLGHGAIFI